MVEVTYQMVLSTLQTAGILIGIFYYITTLRNQNRARQAQLLMQMHIYRRNETKSLNLNFFELTSKKITGFQEYREKVENDIDFREANNAAFGFNEVLGVFVKAGYFDIHNVALMWASKTRMYYENIFEPMIDEARIYYALPRFGSESEYLCKTLIKYMDEHPELKT